MKKINLIIFLLLSTLIVMGLNAQTVGEFGTDIDDILGDKLKSKTNSLNKLDPNEMPVGDVIDADLYVVGPNDRLSLKIIPIADQEEILKVTADGKIALPRNYGVIDVKNKTLNETIELISEKINKSNPEAKVFVSLLKPRIVLISVEGNVKNIGTYNLPASYRVSTVLKIANSSDSKNNSTAAIIKSEKLFDKEKEKLSNYENSGMTFKKTYYQRNIKVFSRDGLLREVDLLKSKVEDYEKYDPFIREGDRIVVPYDREDFPTISISGEVNSPMMLHYKEGDKISVLLNNSYGFTEYADMDNVYLNYADGKRVKLKFDENNNLINDDIVLSSGCIINVGKKIVETNDEIGVVSVMGEVMNAGNYIIHKDKTKLSEIIKQAGGFSEDAYLPLANIIRNDNKNSILDDPMKDYSLFFQNSDLTVEDTMRFNLDSYLKKPYVTVDFVKLFNNDELSQDVILQNGDIIRIPKNPNRVYVFGRVNNPGYVQFEEGKSIDWYINKANGFTEGADIERARIIRANTNVWIKPDENIVVKDGDMIYIPSPPQLSKTTEVMQNQTYISVITALATVGFLIIQIVSLSTAK